MNTFISFIADILLPAACASLKNTYTAYCAGTDIGIETKIDDTPASLADKETEQILRKLIQEVYPTHGIWGEEFGGYQLESLYTWVLDPLDGTKAFLNKKPHHFGSLIGLLHNGVAVAGGIADPLTGKQWIKPTKNSTTTSFIACIAPLSMFGEDYTKIFDGFDVITDLNCIGFAKVADGEILAAVEQGLALHDIVALIPVIHATGAYVLDLQGNDYTTYVFDIVQDASKKFGLITSFDKKTIDILLQRIAAC